MSGLVESHSRRDSRWVIALLLVTILLGGGGVRYGLANLAVQLTALIVLFFHRQELVAFWKNAPFALAALIGMTLLVPLLQLIPLPEHILTILPGREPIVEARSLAGASGWVPFSVDPARTLVSLTGLILPMTVLAIASAHNGQRLITVGWWIVAASVAALFLGMIQVMSNGMIGLLYPENPMPGVLFGTFANRNSAGLFFVGALALAALLPLPERIKAVPFARWVICCLLVLAVLLTRSRSAIVLALLPLGLIAGKAIAARGLSGLKLGSLLVALIAVSGLAFVAAGSNNRVGESFERFKVTQDARIHIWDDAAYSAERYWPVGSGVGTFDEVFQQEESLENLTPRRAGRAHNDYLEVAIEAGLPGLLLIGGWLAVVFWLSWKARRSRLRWEAWAGSTILITIAVQSVTDYALRSQTMLGLAAFALALLWRLGSVRPEGSR